MRLENVLALTHGLLVNSPFVNIFENIVFDSKVVKRGDLFIAFDENEIESAIFNGAYGIIFDKPTQISDTEIAWIKVEDCDNSLKRLVRFNLVEKNITAYRCNEIIVKLALQISTETNFLVIYGNTQSTYKQLTNLNQNSIVLFSPTLSDENIFTNIKDLPVVKEKNIIIKEHTLFETSFIYDNIFFERQILSPLFIPYLEELLNLYKILNINFKLKRFSAIENFKAIFVNKNIEIKEFGGSDKVLIFEPRSDFAVMEVNYLQKMASWANIINLFPELEISKFKDIKNVFFYKNKKDIVSILKNNNFNFALIVSADETILQEARTKEQLTLEF